METTVRDRIRRGVRAAVYRACWRRLEGDETGAQALLACEVPAALSQEGGAGVDDELVRAWLDEDAADFDRAVLICDLVVRRSAGGAAVLPRPAERAPAAVSAVRPRASSGAPAIADLLDGMLAIERRTHAPS